MKTKIIQPLITVPPMPSINRSMGSLFKFPAAIVLLFLAISAFAGPPAGVLDDTHAAVQAVMAVQSEVTPDLMRRPEIWELRLASVPPAFQC